MSTSRHGEVINLNTDPSHLDFDLATAQRPKTNTFFVKCIDHKSAPPSARIRNGHCGKNMPGVLVLSVKVKMGGALLVTADWVFQATGAYGFIWLAAYCGV